MLVKTSELSDIALDWAVAMASGAEIRLIGGRFEFKFPLGSWLADYYPSTDRDIGYWFVEQEKIGTIWIGEEWQAQSYLFKGTGCGPTPLIAAMRCLVIGKMGDTIEIPDELLK